MRSMRRQWTRLREPTIGRQDMGRVDEWKSACSVCENKSKPPKLSSTYFPSSFPSATWPADQDDLLNVPSLRVDIAADR
jgi:hypothetical protein